MTPEDALALKTAYSSDDQYQMVRNACLQHKADIFPSLHRIFEAKVNAILKKLLSLKPQQSVICMICATTHSQEFCC